MSRRQPVSESQLIIPALAVLSQQNEVISTRTLKEGILQIIKAKKADLKNVTDRDQAIIENRIENLISHRSLKAYADYAKIGGKVYIKINGKGKTHLSNTMLNLAEA